ncbi:protein phosphatase 1 regulatory subunit 3G [Sardina pilchardus]|uniref:protein phosphatase 1 regulatory subunit 3G n=1 Tax=Sardina pilchardus TaxID=27697 RepID=UPI002E11E3EB
MSIRCYPQVMDTNPSNSFVPPELPAAFQEFSTSSRREEDKPLDIESTDDDQCPFDLQKSSLKDRRRAKSLPVSAEQACLFESCAKRVQFADTFGLDLANVKHFNVTEDPHVPSKVFSRLKSYPHEEKDGRVVDLCDSFSSSLKLYRLNPTFTMPVESEDFDMRLQQFGVALERVSITHFDVNGVIRAMKTDSAQKEVGVRHTFNDWMTFVDTKAVLQSSKAEQELWNQFVFTLYIPPYMNPGFSVQFAVYYLTDQGHLWDNNAGQNYTLRWDNT